MGVRRWLAAVIGLALVSGALAAAGEHDRGADTEAVATERSTSGEDDDRAPARVRAAATTTPAPTTPVATTAAPPAPPATVRAAGLRTFDRCALVLDHLRAEGLARVTPWGLPGTFGPVAVDPAADTATAGGSSPGAGSSAGAGTSGAAYSTTNVQEAGVDEPDVVKNDGDRVVTLYDGQLRVLRRRGTTMTVTGTLALTEAYGAELLLVGDTVVVLAHGPEGTRVLTVDLRGDVPRRSTDVQLDGSLVAAREAQGIVRLVLVQHGPALEFLAPAGDDDAARAAALDHNRGVIASSTLDDWLPDGQPCDDVYAPGTFAGYGVTNVVTVDPVTGAVADSTSVMASASEVYANAEHLYVASAVWADVTGLQVHSDTTHLHRFDISDPTRAVYEASGWVPGHLIRPGGAHAGQWSMSEHEGDLRIATTIGELWDPASAATSSVIVLRRDGRDLTPIGVVTGLGPTEQLYAVRFIGTRGYVVTYRQTDPLYVVDLADPRVPRVLGELKVPGYSAYLHPIGEGLLLGIGQRDSDEDGRVEGSQVSVFDVRDAANPVRTASFDLGERGTISTVEHDHRAMTWWDDPARAVLPVDSWEEGGFAGAIALHVDASSITEVGRVTHGTDDDTGCRMAISRTRVIDGVVYSFSSAGVSANRLDDFRPLGSTWYADGTQPCTGPHPA